MHCFAITGPTACGKTDVALALAEEFPLEVISMDSAMVYRGMDIGTAKPPPAVRERVPHHLVDIREPEDSYSAGQFAADAPALIREINARGRIALIVGGTMLYLRALREGIAPLPERDPKTRAAIDARAAAEGWEALHSELARIDPEVAGRIEPTDRQRIQRALEVHAVTGRPLSALQRQRGEPAVDVVTVALIPEDRQALGSAIADRFRAMLEAGFADEVRRLHARTGLNAASASMRAVGYRQLWAWLDGRCTRGEAEARAVIATRQLAKRQLTWLRRDSRSVRLAAADPALLDRVRSHLRKASRMLNIG